MKSGVLQAPLSSKRGTVENLKGQESNNPQAVVLFRGDHPCKLVLLARQISPFVMRITV